jgi:hypothetical protein
MMAEVTYQDFDLHIWRDDSERYFAEVRGSPAGAAKPVMLRWPYSEQEHDVLRTKMENAILRSHAKGGLRSSGRLNSYDEAPLREFGSNVFGAVFRDAREVSTLFTASVALVDPRESEGMRLKLSVEPPDMAALPWEYVFGPSGRRDEYLCLRWKYQLVRFFGGSADVGPLAVKGPLRVLAMIANPGKEWELLDIEAERRAIDDVFKNVPKTDVHFRWVEGGTPDDLFNAVHKDGGPWHIFHFIGHGGTDRYIDGDGVERAEGFVVMQDGLGGAVKIPAAQLAGILEDKMVRLAVLNCCESAVGSESASVGAALVRSGVPQAIAMQFPIRNDVAARFSQTFYNKLIQGESAENALAVARKRISLDSLDWGIPVLLTRTGSGSLFKVGPAAPAADAPAPRRAADLEPGVGIVGASRRRQAQEKLRRLWERT